MKGKLHLGQNASNNFVLLYERKTCTIHCFLYSSNLPKMKCIIELSMLGIFVLLGMWDDLHFVLVSC